MGYQNPNRTRKNPNEYIQTDPNDIRMSIFSQIKKKYYQ